MVLPSLRRYVFNVFCPGLSLVLLVFGFRSLSSRVLLRLLSLFSCFCHLQHSVVERGGWQGGKPRNRDAVTRLTATPGVLGHTIDLGNAIAWSSCVADSSKALAGGPGSGVVTSLGMIRIACTLRGVRWRFQSFMNRSVGLLAWNVLFDRSLLTRYARFTYPALQVCSYSNSA